VVDRRGTTWRASSNGGGDWLVARREVWSTGGARGGVDGAVPWLEVSGDGGAPVDMAAASDTLLGVTTLLRDSLKHKEQLSFLTQLKIPSGLQVINSGTNSNLNLP
jgi:hypothetical protein